MLFAGGFSLGNATYSNKSAFHPCLLNQHFFAHNPSMILFNNLKTMHIGITIVYL